jgi:integrase
VVAKYCARVPETETGPTRFGRQGRKDLCRRRKCPGRTVWLTDHCKSVLIDWRRRLGPEFPPYVFPGPRLTHTPIPDYKTAWRTAVRKAGLRDRRIYDLRASFASRANSCNASGLTVAHLLGHDSTQILPTYVKALDENTRAVIGALEAARNSHPLHWKSIQ